MKLYGTERKTECGRGNGGKHSFLVTCLNIHEGLIHAQDQSVRYSVRRTTLEYLFVVVFFRLKQMLGKH